MAEQTVKPTLETVSAENVALRAELDVLNARLAAMHETDNLVRVRFSKPEKMIGQTIMVYDVELPGSGGLKGLTIRGQITQDGKGNVKARIPSAYGSDFVGVRLVEELFHGRKLTERDPDGAQIRDNWEAAIYAAYLASKASNVPVQVVSFRQ